MLRDDAARSKKGKQIGSNRRTSQLNKANPIDSSRTKKKQKHPARGAEFSTNATTTASKKKTETRETEQALRVARETERQLGPSSVERNTRIKNGQVLARSTGSATTAAGVAVAALLRASTPRFNDKTNWE